ncbi:MAG TPA: P-loop NTPase, partial [Methanoculleus sp.]|nr:P-loop NTPase [Methanoculleus sp.]
MKSEKIAKTATATQKVSDEKDMVLSERTLSVRIETRSQKVREELEDAINAVGGMQVRDINDPGGYDLFIVDIGEEHGKDLHFVANILNAGVAGEVFLTSAKTNPEILIEALRIGAKEFFPQPLNAEEVQDALIKFKARAQKERAKVIAAPVRRGKIIDVVGSKGGVGTTTVAVNLATSLASMEGVQSVALMDMNLLFGDIPLFLGIEPVFDWMEVAKNISRLDATYLMSTLYKHHSGIYVLPSPSKLMDEYKVT